MRPRRAPASRSAGACPAGSARPAPDGYTCLAACTQHYHYTLAYNHKPIEARHDTASHTGALQEERGGSTSARHDWQRAHTFLVLIVVHLSR